MKYKPRIAPDQGPVLLVKKGKNRKNCGPSVFEFETRNFDPDHINAKNKILQTIIISPIINRELVSWKRVQTKWTTNFKSVTFHGQFIQDEP